MQRLRRAEFVFLVLIAAAIALEPLIHTHPLTQTSQATCAVCISVVGPITSLPPALTAPPVVVFAMATVGPTAIIHRAAMPLASRAPPAV